MEEDGEGGDSSQEEENRDTPKYLQQDHNGPVVSSSGISLVCPEYGGDSEED